MVGELAEESHIRLVLFFDESGKILIVKPTYKDYWQIPGGVVEADESPMQGATREVKEEIGLTIDDVRFLGVAYTPIGSLQVTFYGGIIDAAKIAEIRVDGDEIGEFRFVETEEAIAMVGEMLRQRLPGLIDAITTEKPSYVEIQKTEATVT